MIPRWLPQTIHQPPPLRKQRTKKWKSSPIEFLPQSNSFPSWIRFRSCYDLFYRKIMHYVSVSHFQDISAGSSVGVSSEKKKKRKKLIIFSVIKGSKRVQSKLPLWNNDSLLLVLRQWAIDERMLISQGSPLPRGFPVNGQRINRPFDVIAHSSSFIMVSLPPTLSIRHSRTVEDSSDLLRFPESHQEWEKTLQLILNWLIKMQSSFLWKKSISTDQIKVGFCLFRGIALSGR